MTGKEPNDGSVNAIVSSFKACKQLADFDQAEAIAQQRSEPTDRSKSLVKYDASKQKLLNDVRIGYTININLPETINVEVYNTIFASIKQNLLSDE